ncbi:hypothetical protein [Acanthopleuribacter pedis]|uniref:Uncharacterized protein n=1 Tax=Acanthopleuribacter pedis TaxID=442870 RepID=A0A8J7Q5Q4_9BACT|nr:hypothetical protein [Acanthopleuribacter pedis]MBO1318324.1 hypothetical protein [Acanthopleuribacter pedis]
MLTQPPSKQQEPSFISKKMTDQENMKNLTAKNVSIYEEWFFFSVGGSEFNR